ncbi:hypothetical protein D3C87_1375680 [compost metagenome]
MAAGFPARVDGPRIAMIEISDWDTHSGQHARFAAQLRGLDSLIGALRDGIGGNVDAKVVLVATEFGRGRGEWHRWHPITERALPRCWSADR